MPRFTRDTGHGISDRGVRPLKTRQKIPGRRTGEDAAQDRPGIRSHIDAAGKHGRDAHTVLRSLMADSPWKPLSRPAPENARATITERTQALHSRQR